MINVTYTERKKTLSMYWFRWSRCLYNQNFIFKKYNRNKNQPPALKGSSYQQKHFSVYPCQSSNNSKSTSQFSRSSLAITPALRDRSFTCWSFASQTCSLVANHNFGRQASRICIQVVDWISNIIRKNRRNYIIDVFSSRMSISIWCSSVHI
jgi:hypothetical protein